MRPISVLDTKSVKSANGRVDTVYLVSLNTRRLMYAVGPGLSVKEDVPEDQIVYASFSEALRAFDFWGVEPNPEVKKEVKEVTVPSIKFGLQKTYIDRTGQKIIIKEKGEDRAMKSKKIVPDEEFIKLMAEGKSQYEMMKILGVASSTANKRVHALMGKGVKYSPRRPLKKKSIPPPKITTVPTECVPSAVIEVNQQLLEKIREGDTDIEVRIISSLTEWLPRLTDSALRRIIAWAENKHEELRRAANVE